MNDLKDIITESFTQYSGAVLQSRALIDVRDGLKPSARQIFYSMLLHKLTADKPHKKTANAVGSAMADFYIHGDASCEGIIMRAGQSFAMRYPLIDVKGNAGSLIASGNWAAPRYTESRLSKITGLLFKDIDKDTINEWRDNYDNSKQYPAVLPSKGFYNLVNGSMGIGIGMASSIPQFNLKELNSTLIYLIDNPDCSFDEIYCAPDFATGGVLYNEQEVKDALKNGQGAACKIRSVVSFDSKDRCFIVTEIPYSVYTNTICAELDEIIDGENNPGIDRYNDLTNTSPLIKIYLTKNANPDKALKYLYKNTSLQSYYGINFTMLDKGRFPKVFTWKETLQAYIDHEKEVYRSGFEHDLKKIEARIHIIDGLLICLASIDDVVQLIKSSASTAAAALNLQQRFLLDADQAKAVLDMRLSRLAKLEIQELQNERELLLKDAEHLKEILSNYELFKNELKRDWKEVADKYGDARRTKILNQVTEDGEPLEKKSLLLSFTNKGSIFVSETSDLYTQRRNSVGSKFKLDKDEYIIESIVGNNTDMALFFTTHGNFYHIKMGDLIIGEKQYLSNFITLYPYESIISAITTTNMQDKKYIVFITKQGLIKKSEINEYNLKRNTGATAIKLDVRDSIISVLFMNEEKVGIASHAGNFIMINTSDIRPLGRVARGVCGMKLNSNDYVVSARVMYPNLANIVSITEDGFIKSTPVSEFHITGRATKGVKLHKTDKLCDFIPVNINDNVLIISTATQLYVNHYDIPKLNRDTTGNHAMKLPENATVIKLHSI